MRKWILGFASAVFGISRLGTFNMLFLYMAFMSNTLYATMLPKALDSKETIFVDGFYFYGGENESVNCRVDTLCISEEELREMDIPKDAPLLYMGEEVCDEIKQSYFLANDTIADKWNDRDKRAILPNQVLNIIHTKTECGDKPCMMNATGRFNLADRNEFAAIELLKNDTKSSPNNSATSHTLGIIYKVFGYTRWQEDKKLEFKKMRVPLSAFETHGFEGEIVGRKRKHPKKEDKNSYDEFLAKEYMLVNTHSMINSYSPSPNFRPILLPSAYIGAHFSRNIALYATPESALKSSANNAHPKQSEVILDSIYYNVKYATLGREKLATRGVHLSAPLLDKVFVLGLGFGKFEKIAQVLVIRGDSVYFWGYIDLQSRAVADEILGFYADSSGNNMQIAKENYSFILRKNMPRQISLNELREFAKISLPAKVKAVVAFESQSVEYARKPFVDTKETSSKAKSSEKIGRDSSGFVAYYQLPINGALNRQLDKDIIKNAINKAKKQGERELEIELEVDLKKGDLPRTTLHKISDEYKAVEFKIVNKTQGTDSANKTDIKITNVGSNNDVAFFVLERKDLEKYTNKDSEELLCIGYELAKQAFVPMYNEKWQLVGTLDKLQLKSENLNIEKILGLNNTGKGDYFIINIRNAQGEVITRNVRVSKSALMPCDKYDIASSPDYAKAEAIMAKMSQISKSKIDDGEWILKLGDEAVGNAKSVKSLKKAIKLAMSWDSDAKVLNMLDLEQGDKRVEYDRGKGYYPQKVRVDFVFVGNDKNISNMLDSIAQKQDDGKNSNEFIQRFLVIFPRVAFILGDDELAYIHLDKIAI